MVSVASLRVSHSRRVQKEKKKMVSSILVDTLSDPTRSLLELYDANQDIDNFPAKVAAHFADIFASKDAFSEVSPTSLPRIHIVSTLSL